MCISVGIIKKSPRSKIGELWWHIASKPYRLFLFSALFHLGVLSVFYLSDTPGITQSITVFIISTAVIAPFILSLLMSFVPDWYHSTAIGYNQYGLSYYLLFFSLIVMELGLIGHYIVFITGVIILMFSWWLSINMIMLSYMWAVRVSFKLASRYDVILKLLLAFIPVNLLFLSVYNMPLLINILNLGLLLTLLAMVFLLYKNKQSGDLTIFSGEKSV